MSKPRIQLPLHTQRLILREFGEADWEAMHDGDIDLDLDELELLPIMSD
jgi:hypothetical protein